MNRLTEDILHPTGDATAVNTAEKTELRRRALPIRRSVWVRGLIAVLTVYSLPDAAERSAFAQGFSAPVVARVSMELRIDGETVDVIHKGDLLNILADDEETVLIATFGGQRGRLSRVNVAQLEESVEIYDELLKEHPDEARFYTLRASAWWARGDEIAALGDYDLAIEKGYREAHAYSSRGMFHAAVGNTEKALADYAEAIHLDPKDESFHINRAAVYLSQQKFDEAVADYSEALKIAPEKPSILQQRAVAWKLSGKPEAAIEDFTAALNTAPNHIPSLMGRGYVYFQMKNAEKAVEDFSAVVSLNPKAADAWNNRGYNRNLLGQFPEALSDYNEALRLAPEYALALVNRSWLLSTCPDESLRNGDKAVESANKACELTGYKDPAGLKALAAAFAEAGNFDKAIGWQEKALELLPEDQRAGEREVLELYRDHKPMRVADIGG